MGIELAQKRTPDLQPDIIFFPPAQASPAGACRGLTRGQIAPARTGFEHPEDAFEDTPVISPGPTGTATLGQQRLNAPPLIITEECLVHCQPSTIQLQMYRIYCARSDELMKPVLRAAGLSVGDVATADES
ncbi:MAG: hypothetical protein R3F13_17630 [Prosthecobacter sp.]